MQPVFVVETHAYEHRRTQKDFNLEMSCLSTDTWSQVFY